MAIKVAVLGGGMGSLAAAWRLANAGNYEVTVYQRGWRLGGKGASGRNAAENQSIEEHGLHILMGFYDHAFNTLKACYDLAPATKHGTWLPWGDGKGKMFTAVDHCGFSQRWKGQWDFFEVPFAPHAGVPWDPPRVLDFGRLFDEGVQVFVDVLLQLQVLPQVNVPAVAVQAIVAAVQTLGTLSAGAIENMLSMAWAAVSPVIDDHDVRWLWMGLCFVGGNLIGMLRDGLAVPAPNFDAINDQDYADWLRQHLANVQDPILLHAPPAAVSWKSPFVEGLYDLAFSDRTTLAAGVTLKAALLLGLAYRGHVAYKMNSGMGDVVFAPLYLALKQKKNVEFRFFHRVTALRTDGTVVTAIELEKQVATQGEYDPLVTAGGHPGWPNEPDKAQLPQQYQTDYVNNGNKVPYDFEYGSLPSKYAAGQVNLIKTNAAGKGDFDIVVLGISVGALEGLCIDLGQANAAFKAMYQKVETVPTQAVQVWLADPPSKFNCPVKNGLAISYDRPFNSWADMTQVLENEEWPGGSAVKSLAYFCDAYYPATTSPKNDVDANATDFLTNRVQGLWPRFVNGPQVVKQRYTRVNADPSDGYVLSQQDRIKYRLDPGGSGFANLALAGDWVRTPLNAGCLEAATLGGRAAAQAIVDGIVHG